RRGRGRVPAQRGTGADRADVRVDGAGRLRGFGRGARRAGERGRGEAGRALRARRPAFAPVAALRPRTGPAHAAARCDPRSRDNIGMSDPRPTEKAPVGSLRALWPFVRAHRGLFAAWLVALACSSTATLSLPVAVRQMIDQGFSSSANIDRAFALLFLVALALARATAARSYFAWRLGERVVADLRGKPYTPLLGLGAAFCDRSRTGELVSRRTADAELLRCVVGSSMSVALRSLVTVVG